MLSVAVRLTWTLLVYAGAHVAPLQATVVVGGVVSGGVGFGWQVAVPESVNVPSSGTKVQSYDPLCRVSLMTPCVEPSIT